LIECAPVGKAGQGIRSRQHRQLPIQLRQPVVEPAQFLIALHQLADVDADGHQSAVAHAPFVGANPAAFGDPMHGHLDGFLRSSSLY
jgi:hypothetical protein